MSDLALDALTEDRTTSKGSKPILELMERNSVGCETSHGNEVLQDTLLQIGQSTILNREVEKLVCNLVVMVKDNFKCDNLPTGTHHHPHVHIQPQIATTSLTNADLGAVDLHQINLTQKLANDPGLEWDSLVAILKNVATGVLHLHEFDKPHGNLRPECVSLSCHNTDHPFIWQDTESSGTATKEGDVKDLGKMFYFVLTNGNQYAGDVSIKALNAFKKNDAYASDEPAEFAKDLIEKMTADNPISISDVLCHPLFWTADKKIYFICEIFDSLAESGDIILDLQTKHQSDAFWENWIDELKIKPIEKDEMPGSEKVDLDAIWRKAGGAKTTKKKKWVLAVGLRTGKKVTDLRLDSMELRKWKKLTEDKKIDKENMNPDIVEFFQKEATETGKVTQYDVLNEVVFKKKETEGGYDKSSLYDLMRFIRNRKAHCWEGTTENADMEREWYRTIGFWNYYSKRFPRLVTFLYNNKTEFPFFNEKLFGC